MKDGYDILFDLVKDALHKKGDYLDDCETYLICFSHSYDNKNWDIGHTMLMGCGTGDKFEWENDFDEGQQYYKLKYIVELSKLWYKLDLEYTYHQLEVNND